MERKILFFDILRESVLKYGLCTQLLLYFNFYGTRLACIRKKQKLISYAVHYLFTIEWS